MFSRIIEAFTGTLLGQRLAGHVLAVAALRIYRAVPLGVLPRVLHFGVTRVWGLRIWI